MSADEREKTLKEMRTFLLLRLLPTFATNKSKTGRRIQAFCETLDRLEVFSRQKKEAEFLFEYNRQEFKPNLLVVKVRAEGEEDVVALRENFKALWQSLVPPESSG